MSIDRSVIAMLRGSCAAKIGTTYLYFKDGLELDPGLKKAMVSISGLGGVPRVQDCVSTLTGVPAAIWSTAVQSLIFPNLSPVYNASIVGAGTDTVLEVYPFLCPGVSIAFPAYGVMKMPDLDLSPDPAKNLYGSMQFVLPLKNNTAWSAANSRYTITSRSAFPDAGNFNFANIATPSFALSLASASAPWSAIAVRDSIKVTWGEKIGIYKSSNEGSVDFAVEDMNPTVQFIGANIDLADMLGRLLIQGTGAGIGRDFNTDAVAVTATAGTGAPQFSATYARLGDSKAQWSAKANEYRNKNNVLDIFRPTGSGAFATLGLAA